MLVLLASVGGCRNSPVDIPDDIVKNPEQIRGRLTDMLRKLPTVNSVKPWELPEMIRDRSSLGLEVITRHYRILTTLQDPLIMRQVPVFLESAFRSYSEVVGEKIHPDKKLLVYLFNTREQWEDFSSFWTRELAPVYLKVKAGAYYFKGACVAYHIGRMPNFSVLAHEGWHQFADETCQYRLPAWLDEGLATNFEAFQWEKGQVTFSPRYNGSRLMALRQTMAHDGLFRLVDLLRLDAGRVLSHSTNDPDNPNADPGVAAYYAQVYALVRFLREENYGQRLQSFRNIIKDAYLGRWPVDADDQAQALQRQHNPTRSWNARVGLLVFQGYIEPPSGEIENEYHAFCRKIVSSVRFNKR